MDEKGKGNVRKKNRRGKEGGSSRILGSPTNDKMYNASDS
jgi:hypothetical protein